jgi:hypothetical protein
VKPANTFVKDSRLKSRVSNYQLLPLLNRQQLVNEASAGAVSVEIDLKYSDLKLSHRFLEVTSLPSLYN